MTRAEIDAIPNSFPVTIVPPQNPAYKVIAAELQRRDTVSGMGKLTSTFVDLRHVTIPVTVEECGKPRAYYSPRTRDIHICYELVAIMPGEFDDTKNYVVAFAALHEMAHALIDVIGVSSQLEEDRADQYALLMLTGVGDVALANEIVAAPAKFFLYLDEEYVHDPNDVHSTDLERAQHAICMLWGRMHDPKLGARLADRAPGCQAYTDEVRSTWNRWLRPYTRLQDGNTF
jgi:hypothetical protein